MTTIAEMTPEERRAYNRNKQRQWLAKKTAEERRALWREKYHRKTPAQKKRANAQSKRWADKNRYHSQASAHQATVRKKYKTAFDEGNISTKKLVEWLNDHRGEPCAYCGEKGVHIDHKAALAMGGTHTFENIQITCPFCNMAKGMLSEEEFLNKIHRIVENMQKNRK